MTEEGWILRTERLRLRPYRLEDLDDLAPILGDPETMRFYPRPFTREQSLNWIRDSLQRYERDGFGLWAMVLKETEEFVGNCGPAVREVDGQREVEIGWHVKRALWGQGLATEAAAACRDHALEALGLRKVISLIRPVNVPSRRVAEKIGMTVEKETFYGNFHHLVYARSRPNENPIPHPPRGHSSGIRKRAPLPTYSNSGVKTEPRTRL